MTDDDRAPELNALERRLLNDYQRDFPMSPTPFADIARDLGITEHEVLDALASLESRGMVSRVGPVLRPNRVGTSTLAAISVPEPRLPHVAQVINAYPEVNHNYEREHEFNLWFVVTARDRDRINEILLEIRRQAGLQVLDLPMEESYHIDLGFPLWC
jgi:DNA-binding Lrp family transcriptional regulator